MQLIYTPRSHFARKVRILMAALGLNAELIDAGNVADAAPAQYGPNPLMKVPTLLDAGITVFESDHIAAYLVRTRDPADRFDVLTSDVDRLNARAVLNGVMAQEAEVILAERTGIETRGLPRFDKMRDGISAGLAWLEQHDALFAGAPDYLGFHLVAAWEHMARFGPVPLDAYTRLRTHVERYCAFDFIAASAPP